MSHPFTLAGRVALITGASSGIGAATAALFGDLGAAVAVGYHSNRTGAEPVRDRILAAGGRAIAVSADLTSTRAVAPLVEVTVSALGPIDVLVNNAGSLVERLPLSALTEEAWDRIYALNVKSAVFLTQAIAPSMIERQRGAIVNVGSIAGHNGGGPGAGAYASAKAALMAYTKSLAKELAPRGVRVNAVAPGVIDTPFHERFSTADMLRTFVAAIPLGRLGTSEECAAAIAFLASDAASYIVGETIEINGGQLMR